MKNRSLFILLSFVALWSIASLMLVFANFMPHEKEEITMQKEAYSGITEYSEISNPSIDLDNGGSIKAFYPSSSDNIKEASWSIWVKQDSYNEKAGILHKYDSYIGKRGFIIMTTRGDAISILTSPDGEESEIETSSSEKRCGVREDGKWTLLTITYNGSRFTYYRDGKYCDRDDTEISSIHGSPIPLTIGGYGGKNFDGRVDEFIMFDKALNPKQVERIYKESNYGGDLGQSIPVLVYHKIVNDSADERDEVTMQEFERQIGYLHEKGFETITAEEFRQWKEERKEIPDKAVIIFFDDGRIETYQNAMPIMDKYGYKGNIALVEDYFRRIRGGESYMHMDEIKELRGKGWGLESHSSSHINLLTLNESDFRDELIHTKYWIKYVFGKEPSSFVFPYNLANSTYMEICKEEYALCWARSASVNRPEYNYLYEEDEHQTGLVRITIRNTEDFERFKQVFQREGDRLIELQMDEGRGDLTMDLTPDGDYAILVNGAKWD